MSLRLRTYGLAIALMMGVFISFMRPNMARAVDVPTCNNQAVALAIDVSDRTRYRMEESSPSKDTTKLDAIIAAAQHIIGRLVLDNTIRCPNSRYSIGAYVYGMAGNAREITELKFRSLDLTGMRFSDPNWKDKLSKTLSSFSDSVQQASAKSSGNSAYPGDALTLISSAFVGATDAKSVVILSSGEDQGFETIARTLATTTSIYVISHVTPVSTNRWSKANINSTTLMPVDTPANMTSTADSALDIILGQKALSAYKCNEPIPLEGYQDRALFEISGTVPTSAYSISVGSDKVLDSGNPHNPQLVHVWQAGNSNHFWVSVFQPGGGQWSISTGSSAPCRVRVILLPLVDSPSAIVPTGILAIYNKDPFYPAGSAARLPVSLKYSNDESVRPVGTDTLSVTGTIQQNGETVGVPLPFQFDVNANAWVSQNPPPVPHAGLYTITLIGSANNREVFRSGAKDYTVLDIKAVQLRIDSPSADAPPFNINCANKQSGKVEPCAVTVRLRIEQITTTNPLPMVAAHDLYETMTDGVPITAQLKLAERNVGSALNFKETGTPGLLEVALPFEAISDTTDTTNSYTIEIRATDPNVSKNYQLINMQDVVTIQAKNNRDAGVFLSIKVLTPSTTSKEIYPLYADFPRNCPFVQQTIPLPVKIQVVDEASNKPIAFATFGNKNKVSAFASAVLISPAQQSKTIELKAEGDYLSSDLSAPIAELGEGPGKYTLTLLFRDDQIDTTQYIFRDLVASQKYEIAVEDRNAALCYVAYGGGTLFGVLLIGTVLFFTLFTSPVIGWVSIRSRDGRMKALEKKINVLNRRLRITRTERITDPELVKYGIDYVVISGLPKKNDVRRIQIKSYKDRTLLIEHDVLDGESRSFNDKLNIEYVSGRTPTHSTPTPTARPPLTRPTGGVATRIDLPTSSPEPPTAGPTGPIIPDDF